RPWSTPSQSGGERSPESTSIAEPPSYGFDCVNACASIFAIPAPWSRPCLRRTEGVEASGTREESAGRGDESCSELRTILDRSNRNQCPSHPIRSFLRRRLSRRPDPI